MGDIWASIIGAATSLGILAITQWRAVKDSRRRDERDAERQAQERRDRDRERIFEHRKEAYLDFLQAGRAAIGAISSLRRGVDKAVPGAELPQWRKFMAVSVAFLPVTVWGTRQAKDAAMHVLGAVSPAMVSEETAKQASLGELWSAMSAFEAIARADLGIDD